MFVWKHCVDLVSIMKIMHAGHILHHDIHPGNFIHHSGRFYIVDFGLSSVMGCQFKVARVYGRLNYLPPEIFKKEQYTYTEASEIHCLGTLIWQIITGVPLRG